MKLIDLFEKTRSILTVMGEQKEPYGNFSCNTEGLTSLVDMPDIINGNFSCRDNKLTSLKGIHKIIKQIKGTANFSGNPIKSHVLGLLLIDGLTAVVLDNKKVQTIVNKHLVGGGGDGDIHACQEELIEDSLPEFATL